MYLVTQAQSSFSKPGEQSIFEDGYEIVTGQLTFVLLVVVET